MDYHGHMPEQYAAAPGPQIANAFAPGHVLTHECDGTPFWKGGGTLRGHLGPGAVFVLWGCWWLLSSCHRYFVREPRAYHAYRGATFDARWLELVEPLAKVVLPSLMVFVELYLDHDTYRNLYCPDGTFAQTHINNWQHSSSYPGFIFSGLVDLLSKRRELPAGTQQAALALAFMVEGLLMGLHEKHEPLDAAVHQLFAATTFACVAGVLLELAKPRNLLASLAKAGAVLLQGAWLWQAGWIMFGGLPNWRVGDMAAHMMVPVVFCWILLGVAAFMLAAFLALQTLYARNTKAYACLPRYDPDIDHHLDPDHQHTALKSAAAFGSIRGHTAATQGVGNEEGASHCRCDSANEGYSSSRDGSFTAASDPCAGGSADVRFQLVEEEGGTLDGASYERRDSANERDSRSFMKGGSPTGSAGSGGGFGVRSPFDMAALRHLQSRLGGAVGGHGTNARNCSSFSSPAEDAAAVELAPLV